MQIKSRMFKAEIMRDKQKHEARNKNQKTYRRETLENTGKHWESQGWETQRHQGAHTVLTEQVNTEKGREVTQWEDLRRHTGHTRAQFQNKTGNSRITPRSLDTTWKQHETLLVVSPGSLHMNTSIENLENAVMAAEQYLVIFANIYCT